MDNSTVARYTTTAVDERTTENKGQVFVHCPVSWLQMKLPRRLTAA